MISPLTVSCIHSQVSIQKKDRMQVCIWFRNQNLTLLHITSHRTIQSTITFFTNLSLTIHIINASYKKVLGLFTNTLTLNFQMKLEIQFRTIQSSSLCMVVFRLTFEKQWGNLNSKFMRLHYIQTISLFDLIKNTSLVVDLKSDVILSIMIS